ncbi:MAG: histidine phosphatase family protein [Pseudobdellovibrionaceae bacterium]
MNTLKDFYFLRHGETDWNREHRGMGQQDIPLNPNGVQQAQAAADIFQSEKIRTICHSPLIRAKRTAEIIADKLNCAMVEVPELIECSWGQQEGQIKGKWTEDWILGKEIEGAESYQGFVQRAIVGINRSLEEKGPVLIVSHGGVFWAVLQYGKIASRIDLQNAVPVYLRAPLKLQDPWALSEL